ncbi:MAG TPA: exosortase family protein XrtF [Flavobacteriaceae bacterium]|nr:exosortase family protein XrtF [Flavobacteriaceae bacterium]
MLKIISENKAVVRFLVIFGGLYLILALLYKLYLGMEFSINHFPDYFTHLVSVQSSEMVQVFGYSSKVEPHPFQESMKFFVNGEFLARIVEGCNAISVIILFVSFIFAFYKDAKKTFLFAFAGAVFIYAINIFRIALLAIGIYEYPEYSGFLHGTVFPAIIYGTVFFLWFLWVKNFSKK